MDASKVEKEIGVEFSDKSLIEMSLTHRSYVNENRKHKKSHNERLEFLGDAVLELSITDYLYRKFPKKAEGDLTLYRAALVNTDTLAQVSADIGLNKFILLSRGESRDTGRARHSILADVLESVIGAIYLDKGYAVADKFILENVAPLIDEIIENKTWIDAKSLFQEKAQEVDGVTPHYDTLDEVGPDHDKVFIVGVHILDDLIAKGEGKSKQEAAQVAAQNGLEAKGWE